VGSGEAVTMRNFVELTKQVACASTELDFGAVPYRANEAMLSVADTARLCGLGWQPEVTLADGIKSMLNATALP
jgi:nucleoside-diphosphate-sugar epimerase